MSKQIHYGTVTHWFTELKRGSVLSDDHGSQRILLDGRSLGKNYLLPKSGDRISFSLYQDGSGRWCAESVELLPPLKENERVKVTLTEWDYQQNGGYCIHQVQKTAPIFVLGQFLNDQTRIPAAGEVLEGRLVKHGSGKWLLVETDIIGMPSENSAPTADAEPGTTEQAEAASQENAAVSGNAAAAPVGVVTPAAEGKAAQHGHNTLPPNKVLGGEIASWDGESGFGFILTPEKQSVFFHVSAFHYVSQCPEVGRQVSFYCNRPADGEPQKAMKVVLGGHEASLFSDLPYDYHGPAQNMQKILACGAAGSVYLLCVAYFSVKLALVYLLASAAAFWLYRSDKQTAVSRAHGGGYIGRVPEKNLHQIGLIGGWPGGLLARAVFNHKTGKKPFVRMFWITVAANIAATYLLLVHYGGNPLALFLRN